MMKRMRFFLVILVFCMLFSPIFGEENEEKEKFFDFYLSGAYSFINGYAVGYGEAGFTLQPKTMLLQVVSNFDYVKGIREKYGFSATIGPDFKLFKKNGEKRFDIGLFLAFDWAQTIIDGYEKYAHYQIRPIIRLSSGRGELTAFYAKHLSPEQEIKRENLPTIFWRDSYGTYQDDQEEFTYSYALDQWGGEFLWSPLDFFRIGGNGRWNSVKGHFFSLSAELRLNIRPFHFNVGINPHISYNEYYRGNENEIDLYQIVVTKEPKFRYPSFGINIRIGSEESNFSSLPKKKRVLVILPEDRIRKERNEKKTIRINEPLSGNFLIECCCPLCSVYTWNYDMSVNLNIYGGKGPYKITKIEFGDGQFIDYGEDGVDPSEVKGLHDYAYSKPNPTSAEVINYIAKVFFIDSLSIIPSFASLEWKIKDCSLTPPPSPPPPPCNKCGETGLHGDGGSDTRNWNNISEGNFSKQVTVYNNGACNWKNFLIRAKVEEQQSSALRARNETRFNLAAHSQIVITITYNNSARTISFSIGSDSPLTMAMPLESFSGYDGINLNEKIILTNNEGFGIIQCINLKMQFATECGANF